MKTTAKRKPAAKLIRQPRTFRDVLKIIDTHLVKAEDANKLWDVLSALRGPDAGGSEALKNATTVPIRRAAFPKRAKAMENGGKMGRRHIGASFTPAGLFVLPTDYSHFAGHVKSAAKTLGL